MSEQINFMVHVSCMTFNHVSFIENTMTGFTIQRTDFPFVCVIVDDASTDGEPEVIRNYMTRNFNLEDKSLVRNEETDDYTMTFAQHKTNKSCYFAVYYLKYNHYSIKKSKELYYPEYYNNAKYLAICEGDDYWIHPKKLQMQVDFLETHADYSMCHGDAEFFVFEKNWNKGRVGRVQSKAKSFDSTDKYIMFNRILTGDYPGIVTCTALVRMDFYNNVIPNDRSFMMGDKPLWLDMSQMGRIKYFDNVFGVYVKHQGSATRTPKTRKYFTLNAHEMKIYYCKKYNYPIPAKIFKLYKKGYLDLYFCGENPPIMKMPQLEILKNYIIRMNNSKGYKILGKLLFRLQSKWDIVEEKFKLLYLYLSNMIWRITHR